MQTMDSNNLPAPKRYPKRKPRAGFGFAWAAPEKLGLPQIQKPDTGRAIWRAKKIFADIIHGITSLEGNPFTVPEIQTLLDGITVGGRKVSEAEQVLNQKASLLRLFEMVETKTFSLSPAVALDLQSLAAKGEALEEGVFRTGKVGISGTAYIPPAGSGLEKQFETMARAAEQIANPFEKGMAVFLYVARTQCFWDGNKRTGRLLMNGVLLQAGQDIIAVPAGKALEFNQKMTRFYDSADATEMMRFLSGLQIRDKFEP